jgi:RNA polymerase sigma factor (sigma-70 family)
VRGSSDQRLVARVASGDAQAFEEIFDRYGPGLLGFCVHMLGDREWGEDALQLTFVAAYQALCRGECDGALRPWLYAIARNRCLSELRARREIPDGDAVSADRLTIDGPASLSARREQLREIVEDIQRLPADQRAALVLFELGDQSHEEIAAELGVRREKVKALIFQAREGLLRGRIARERACSEVQEGLANARGKVPARGVLRAHIDRCAHCQAFEREVRTQRAALALVLPIALSGKVKALILSSVLGHGSASAGAAASGGSLGGAAAAGGGTVSAAAGSAAPTMVASLGADAVAGVGAITSSVSAATVAKLATVVVVAVGVGGVTRSALQSSPRPQVSFVAGQPMRAAPLRAPFQALASGINNPLDDAPQAGLPPRALAAARAGAPARSAARGPTSFSSSGPSSSANFTAVSAPGAPGLGAAASPTPTTSAPASSASDNGSATTTAPSSGTSTTTTATTTTTTTTTTASSPTTSAGPSSGSSASPGSSTPSRGASGKTPGHSTSQSSGRDSAGGTTHSDENGPSTTRPGCVHNRSPGCAKKNRHS